jgi:hypothetical protein
LIDKRLLELLIGQVREFARPPDLALAVLALAVNAMRCQSMIGNTALVLEAEMFGQPRWRAKWKKKYGARPEDMNGLAVGEHVARLRDKLLPLVEKSHRIVRESIEAMDEVGLGRWPRSSWGRRRCARGLRR